ncbi:MAG TPA: transcription termination factor Rho [Gemmatimonadaceae bacterium]
MNERRRPPRRGRGQRPHERPAAESTGEPNPYRDEPIDSSNVDAPVPSARGDEDTPQPRATTTIENDRPPRHVEPEVAPDLPPPVTAQRDDDAPVRSAAEEGDTREEAPRPETFQPRLQNGSAENAGQGVTMANGTTPQQSSSNYTPNAPRHEGSYPPREHRNGRRRRRGRDRGPRRDHQQQPPAPVSLAPSGDTKGWFDPSRDGGFIRRAADSYLAEAGDAWVPPTVVRQFGIRKSDLIDASVGRDQRGRVTVMEIRSINDIDPSTAARRAEFNSLPASYPERKLTLETGRPARGGAELIRRAIDLIAPIGYGQRALIVAPARAGKTTLLHGITEGVAINHPNASLIILLVDERPEEVSEAISWGVGEVVASSFDQPAERHVEVTEMVLERARRLVEIGKDVVIVLDSLTRMARAHNTAERGTGRTLSGGLDATAMAKPKAFFGSARAIPASAGGGSLTIIATALVETGSRMDDVIFEEFKGTGNCEIKLDRPLAEKRIYPAIDIGASGTRREEKLFRPDQLDGVYTLRRGLSQMPPQSAMEWLIKRIAGTPSNDALLAGL